MWEGPHETLSGDEVSGLFHISTSAAPESSTTKPKANKGDNGLGGQYPPKGPFSQFDLAYGFGCGVRVDGSVLRWGDYPVITLAH